MTNSPFFIHFDFFQFSTVSLFYLEQKYSLFLNHFLFLIKQMDNLVQFFKYLNGKNNEPNYYTQPYQHRKHPTITIAHAHSLTSHMSPYIIPPPDYQKETF